MTSDTKTSPNLKATYTFALSPGLQLTIKCTETKTVKLKIANPKTLQDQHLSVPVQTKDAKGYPQIVLGSCSSKTLTYPQMEIELTCENDTDASWVQTVFNVENGFPTGSEPEFAQATVGLKTKSQTWQYPPDGKKHGWMITPQQDNHNFIAISPPQKSQGIQHLYQELNPDMVSFLDYVTPSNQTSSGKTSAKNYLFRGNEPLTAPTKRDGPQTVDFEGLHKIMATRYKNATGQDDFPTDTSGYIFHDICLRNPNNDGCQELQAFDPSMASIKISTTLAEVKSQKWITSPKAPNKAKMIWWPVQPSAPNFDSGDFLFSLDEWAGTELNSLMQTPQEVPHVYYIHCANGHDRTGLVAYSYFIARGEPQQQAYILGSTVCLSQTNPTKCVSLQNDLTPESGSPKSDNWTRVFPGGGEGSYFDTMSHIGSGGNLSWGTNAYVDESPYGVIEKPTYNVAKSK